jgi:ribosome-binding factor A
MQEVRKKKIESLLKEEISIFLLKGELNDPRVKTELVAITDVEVTTDLKEAKVYVSCLAEEAEQKKTINALNHAAGYIQHLLGKRIHFKSTPQLKFILDLSVERGFRITQKLKDIGS